MSSMGLIEAYWKTERAKHHLEELKSQVARFAEFESYTITTEDDVEKGVHRVELRFNEPHVWIHLIAGDLFHCLRSALDNAVYRLAQDRVTYPYWTQFPILEEDTKDTRKRFENYTREVCPEAIEVIKSLQPYMRPEGEPPTAHVLWVLNKLCNIDKHRRIPIRGQVIDVKGTFPATGINILRDDNDGCIVTVPLSRKSEVAFKPVAVDVIFGDPSEGVEIGVLEIEQMYQFVAGHVIPRLSSFCK